MNIKEVLKKNKFMIITAVLVFFMVINCKNEEQPLEKKSEEYYKKIHKVLLENLIILLEIFEEENIEYCASAGTLLGAIRNKNIIAKDDDIDLTIMTDDFKRLKDSIKNKNDLYYKFHNKGLHLYINRDLKSVLWNIIKVVKLDENGNYSKNNIFIDIMETKELNGKIMFGDFGQRWEWENNWFYKEEFFPLRKGKLNGIDINIPNKPIANLKRNYGDCSKDKCWEIPLEEEGHHQKEINLN